MKNIIKVILVVGLFVLASCSDDPVTNNTPETFDVVVINEGVYGNNNSTVTVYNTAEGTSTNNAYYSANGKRLGDTGNSAAISEDGEYIYVCVTNSNKVEAINSDDMISAGMIDMGGYGSPREIILTGNKIGYVTTLNNTVAKIDFNTMQILNETSVGSQPEGLVQSNGYLFVANSGFGGDNTVSVIDTSSFLEHTKLTVEYNPRFVQNYNNKVYVVCTGIYDSLGHGGVYEIDPASLTITDSLGFNNNPGECDVTTDGTMLLVSNIGLHKVNLSDLHNNVDDTPFILPEDVNSTNEYIYSVKVNSINEIYLGNAKDFTQNGEIAVYNINGSELYRFECGLNPGTILISK